jgi:hypothetical protein
MAMKPQELLKLYERKRTFDEESMASLDRDLRLMPVGSTRPRDLAAFDDLLDRYQITPREVARRELQLTAESWQADCKNDDLKVTVYSSPTHFRIADVKKGRLFELPRDARLAQDL